MLRESPTNARANRLSSQPLDDDGHGDAPGRKPSMIDVTDDVVQQAVPSPRASGLNRASQTYLVDPEIASAVHEPATFEELMDPETVVPEDTPFGEALKAQSHLHTTHVPGRHYIPRARAGEITREHEQYNLTYAMMIGIRHSVTTWQTTHEGSGRISGHHTLKDVGVRDMKSGVRPEHFTNSYKLFFPPEGRAAGSALQKTPPHKLKYGFKFKDYAPEVFARLRKRFDINDVDYMLSLCGSFNFLEFVSNSKSGEFFFYSHDGRFLIKTQRKSESQFMRSVLQQYFNFVADNPKTILVRLCGAHRVKLPHLRRRMHFVIMMSVFAEATIARPVHRIYDLKGATAGRKAKADETVRKDLDILSDGQTLKLGRRRQDFVDQIAKDAGFLEAIGVMDYSLLVGIHDRAPGDQQQFVFRSDRKASLLSLQLKEPTSMDLSGAANAPSVLGALAAANPGLPKKFSNLQVTMTLDGAAAIASASPKPTPKTTTSVPNPIITNPSPTNSMARFPSTEFNSFYKIESHDTNSNAALDETYHVGLIDIFTKYSNRKRTEHALKSLVSDAKTISAVDPHLYKKRFVEFVTSITR